MAKSGALPPTGLSAHLPVFILAILVVEPWKRKKLGETFDERMVVPERENKALMRDGMETVK